VKKPALRSMLNKPVDRESAVQMRVTSQWFEEVDHDDPSLFLEVGQKREWVVDVLDHIETVDGVVAARNVVTVEIEKPSCMAAFPKSPPQVACAWVFEVRKVDAVSSFQ
jgi:hypothetical protein